jgi:hypothetical protein
MYARPIIILKEKAPMDGPCFLFIVMLLAGHCPYIR